jgi:hypothetical protein
MQASVGVIRFISRHQALNGKTNEVGTREDLVAALKNNTLKVTEVAPVA